jgi:hypothetical protein
MNFRTKKEKFPFSEFGGFKCREEFEDPCVNAEKGSFYWLHRGVGVELTSVGRVGQERPNTGLR